MRAATFTAAAASLIMAVAAVPQGFNCKVRTVPIRHESNKLLIAQPNKYEILTSTKSEGFCTYSDPNCNFCLNIDPAAKLKVCQAIDPTYKSAPGDITRGPSGADFQCVVTCCH
ncbi:hypothetical protein KHU50_013203 [Colletotrichum sp. SAR 10_65]|nr:hypothetical protein KHU50_013203 [Colletotrichum sp. SAR 10_65]KAI8212180.1 hypothetical protein K4K52_008708 [Colletotrichum sp. SAR 10_76]KAI8226547.1 hypothetical protein K4K53_006075 [Colletotrichum sp. SAR 10_77]